MSAGPNCIGVLPNAGINTRIMQKPQSVITRTDEPLKVLSVKPHADSNRTHDIPMKLPAQSIEP